MQKQEFVKLESKVDAISKALNVLLLEDVFISKKELKEVKARLRDWLAGKKSNFMTLEAALHDL
jgi:hypothetical protein